MQDDGEMEDRFRRHLAAVKPWLARQPNMDVLYVSYNRLVQEDAALLCNSVAEFIGVPLDTGRMRAVPSRDLYRNRKIPA